MSNTMPDFFIFIYRRVMGVLFCISKVEHAIYKYPLNFLFTDEIGTVVEFCSNVARIFIFVVGVYLKTTAY